MIFLLTEICDWYNVQNTPKAAVSITVKINGEPFLFHTIYNQSVRLPTYNLVDYEPKSEHHRSLSYPSHAQSP
jgi:hypothetical protein